MGPVTTLADHAALVAALRDPAAWPRPPARVEVIETHISTVLLGGGYACKLKKPVRFSFLDFGTAERRRRFCEEELRINRRSAPDIYLGVVPIAGVPPRIGAPGARDPQAIEHAVWMRRFDPAQVLDQVVQRDGLDEPLIDALAAAVAQLHATAAPAPAGSDYGTAAIALGWARRNLDDLRADAHAAADRDRIDALRAWTESEAARLAPALAARVAAGRIRECHGDLHLGNVALVDGRPLPFDALEFDPALRFIDVASDIAFLFMDLLDHGRPRLAWRLLNRWFEASGDWDAATVLRFHAVYRALVRARVAQLRAQQPATTRLSRVRLQVSYTHYLALAATLARPAAPLLVVMSGLSGSGKSTVALALAERLGALRLRSDVERKRLAGLAPEQRGDAGLYAPAMTARTYARLAQIAGLLLDAGIGAVVDAASLRADERRALAAVAQQRGLPAAVVRCEAPADVLRQRVGARASAAADASDATLAVLQQQPGWREPRAADEPPHHVIDTAVAAAELSAACDVLAQQLAAGSGAAADCSLARMRHGEAGAA